MLDSVMKNFEPKLKRHDPTRTVEAQVVSLFAGFCNSRLKLNLPAEAAAFDAIRDMLL